MAFRMAGVFAFRDAMAKAGPTLLEPIMLVEVTTPEAYQGDLIGDLTRRRGRIQNMQVGNKATHISAMVPLETMFGYATDLRSLSRGRANYSMEPSHFEDVPASLASHVVQTFHREPART